MCTSFHAFGEGVFWDAHSNCCHFSNCVDRLVHEVTPLVHFGLPFRELLRNHLREVVSCSFRPLADFPHKPPLLVKHRHDGRLRQILQVKI